MSRSILLLAPTAAALIAACGPTSSTGTPVPLPAASNTPTGALTPTAATPTPDPTAGWTQVSSPAGRFTVRHPASLTVTFNCASQMLLAPAPQQVTPCDAQGDSGQPPIDVESTDGDQRSQIGQSGSSFPNIGIAAPLSGGTPVTAGGVTGSEYTVVWTTDGQGVTKGEKQLVDVFFTGGRTYVAVLSEDPAQPDLTDTFHLMVATLVFG